MRAKTHQAHSVGIEWVVSKMHVLSSAQVKIAIMQELLFYLDRMQPFDRVGPILNELQAQHGLLFGALQACTNLDSIPEAIYTLKSRGELGDFVICGSSPSTASNTGSVHSVILRDITISFCCF